MFSKIYYDDLMERKTIPFVFPTLAVFPAIFFLYSKDSEFVTGSTKTFF